jgi:formylglycine-generating enzyme required for sulfatase activity
MPENNENGACVAPDVIVEIPETRITIGASDWEADKIVHAREIHVMPFALDAFEVTEARLHPASPPDEDGARAAAGISRDEMIAYCTHRGGRLPTEDEWIAAASGAKASRYPWGDTGAVCRRGAWGMRDGPCAHGATGPDTVGSHEDGDTALGVHDLAGNVAEWVSVSDASAHAGAGVVLGGSFASSLASELRVWSRAYVDPAAHDFTVGGRCAFDRGQR